jgi:Domain of unknown function (DUF1877)
VGMVLVGRLLSATELRGVLDDPTLIDGLLYGDLEDEDAEMPEPQLDIDKSWHGIHYLLTGSAWEVGEGAGAAILGGDPIGEDNGYGPARLLPPDAVQAVAAGLQGLDPETLRTRFDPEAMEQADLYPAIWSESDVFDTYLLPYFAELSRFYQAAAVDGAAVLLVLT